MNHFDSDIFQADVSVYIILEACVNDADFQPKSSLHCDKIII